VCTTEASTSSITRPVQYPVKPGSLTTFTFASTFLLGLDLNKSGVTLNTSDVYLPIQGFVSLWPSILSDRGTRIWMVTEPLMEADSLIQH